MLSPLHAVFGRAVRVAAPKHHPGRVRDNGGVAAVRPAHPQAAVVVHGDRHVRGQAGEQAAHDAASGHPHRVEKRRHGVAPRGRRRVRVPVACLSPRVKKTHDTGGFYIAWPRLEAARARSSRSQELL